MAGGTHDDSGDPAQAWAGEAAGAVLGPYTLIERLGEGGFGTVWVAEQHEPVRRQVALKILKGGMASAEVLARFEAERQALALMDHPGIARVLDAGTTPTGQPYIVMQLVPGQRITAYADHQGLDLTARLALFCEVCHAVQHAHHKGVVHRDLKPDNVLVSEDQGRATPRIIDFGIAKAMEAPLTEATLETGAHQIMGTPAYMAPEQATRSADVDTRADVYSLGALLYELLTGESNVDLTRRGTTTLREMLRQICEEDAPRPSERVLGLDPEHRRVVPSMRGTTLERLARDLRGDLDWIVMRALEKDRDRRYPSPSALAEDVQRHLDHEPVLAGPPSAFYRLGKLARRHRGVATGVAVGIVGLITTLGVLSWSVVRVGDERDAAEHARGLEAEARGEAERSREDALESRDAADAARARETLARADAEGARDEAREAQRLAETRLRIAEDSLAASRAVTDFLGDMLAAASPDDLGFDATVLSVLERAAPSIGARFADRPFVESELRYTVGTTYRSLGELQLAREHLERAHALLVELWGADHPDTLVCEQHIVLVDWQAGVTQQGLEDIEAIHTALVEQLDPDDSRRIEALNVLGILRNELGDLDGAGEAWSEVAERRTRLHGDDALSTLEAQHNLAIVLDATGRSQESLDMQRDIFERLSAQLGPEHPHSLRVLNDVGTSLKSLGRYAEAVEVVEALLETRRRVLGPDHPMTVSTLANLATMVYLEGRLARAKELSAEAIAACRRVLGDDHAVTLLALDGMGSVLVDLEQYDEARPFVQAAFEGRRRKFGDDHDDTLISLQNLGAFANDTGDVRRAVELFGELLERRERVSGPRHPMTIRARYVLADALMRMSEPLKALELLDRAETDSLEVNGPDSTFTLDIQANQGWVLLDLFRYEEAEEVFLDVYEGRSVALGDDHPMTVNILEGLARLYRDSGRDAELRAIARTLFGYAKRAAESEDAKPWDYSLLSWYYAESLDESLRDPELAVVWAERANDATDWSVPRYLDSLATARRANGDLEGGIEAHRRALEVMSPGDGMRGYHEEVLAEWEALLRSRP